VPVADPGFTDDSTTDAGAARFLNQAAYGASPTDLASFVVVPVVLLAVTLVAAAVPARRASRVDPLVTLRGQ